MSNISILLVFFKFDQYNQSTINVKIGGKSAMISKNKAKGFTIVELLIVIVIIGILAAISIVAYNGVTQKARDDQRVSDARNIANAAASYNAETGAWPTIGQLKGVDNVTGTTAPFATVKLSGTAATNLGTNAPDASNKNRYLYQYCNNTASGAIAIADATGIKVIYTKEQDSAYNKEIAAGSGTRCVNAS